MRTVQCWHTQGTYAYCTLHKTFHAKREKLNMDVGDNAQEKYRGWYQERAPQQHQLVQLPDHCWQRVPGPPCLL